MEQNDGKIELTELERNDPQMNQIRNAALEIAFEEGYLKSPREYTTMEAPRYMVKIPGLPMKYEWLCRILTTKGHLDKEEEHPSGLFKFVLTMDSASCKPAKVDVEQIFV
ncbi:hypothetical protein ACTXT7_016454 [Hymenolepis weldensis]